MAYVLSDQKQLPYSKAMIPTLIQQKEFFSTESSVYRSNLFSHSISHPILSSLHARFLAHHISNMASSHSTTRISFAPRIYSSSVGLFKGNVQLVLAQIRRCCGERNPIDAKKGWGRTISQILHKINGRLLRIHGFTPAEILMGFNPEYKAQLRVLRRLPSAASIMLATIDSTQGHEYPFVLLDLVTSSCPRYSSCFLTEVG